MELSEIDRFFEERKEGWLKKNLKASMGDVERDEKHQECEALFDPENWLPNASKRAGQISISTHPCTFSHPSARKNVNGSATSIIAAKGKVNDGYLRSGNVSTEPDALGNAAALDVYKFLTLTMPDEKTLLEHIQIDSKLAKDALKINSTSYEELKAGFLAMVQNSDKAVSSSKIKQIYFPVENGYHLLSLLTASGIVFELRKRIDDIRFSEATKEARSLEKEMKLSVQGYKQLVNLTTIGYGGTKPQNISVLNNRNAGKAHLLSCEPPTIKVRNIRFPTQNFFTQSFRYNRCKDVFHSLHRLFMSYKNDWYVRSERDEYYRAIIDRIVDHTWSLRAVAHEQFNSETARLANSQQVWLCDDEDARKEREGKDDWLEDIVDQVARYIFNGYEKSLGKKAVIFSNKEFDHIYKLVVSSKEAFR